VLRGARLGELAALDQKTLEEKKSFKLQWCGAEGEAKPEAEGAAGCRPLAAAWCWLGSSRGPASRAGRSW